MRNRAAIGIALMAVLVVMGASALWAQGPGPRMRAPGAPMAGPGGLGDIGIPLPALNLSDAQKEQVRAVMESHREESQQLMQRLGPAHQAVREAVNSIPVDEALIRSRSAALAAVEADAAVFRARLRSEVFAILTPEQQQQANEPRARRPAGARGQRREPR